MCSSDLLYRMPVTLAKPLVRGGVVLVGDSSGSVRGLEIPSKPAEGGPSTTYAVKWHKDIGMAMSQPRLAGAVAYFGSLDSSYVLGLDVDTGTEVFRHDNWDGATGQRGDWSTQGAVVVQGGVAYFGVAAGYVRGVSTARPDTGPHPQQFQYKVDDGAGEVVGTPHISAGVIYFVTQSQGLFAVDVAKQELIRVMRPASGPLWSFDAEPVVHGGVVYVGAADAMYGFDVGTGVERLRHAGRTPATGLPRVEGLVEFLRAAAQIGRAHV